MNKESGKESKKEEANVVNKKNRNTKEANVANDQVALIKAVGTIKKSIDTFEKSVEECKKLVEEKLEDLELHTSLKRKAIDELEQEYEQKKKSRRIDLEQDIRAFGYTEALKILKERKESPIPEEDLAKLKAELQSIKQDHQNVLNETIAQEKAKHQKEMKHFTETSDLRHQTEMAKREALIHQLQDHIKVLETTIVSQKEDIDKQRELTKSVAESARPQPQYFHPKQ